MAKNNNLQDLLKSVADAIRFKKGTTDLINAQDFDQEIRTIQGVGDNTKEVVKAISGIESDEDVTLANAIAKAYDDTPTEQIWSGTRTTANGATIKDGVASVHSIKGATIVSNGELLSSMPREIVSRGRNLWDEEWERGQLNVNTGVWTPSEGGYLGGKNPIPCQPNTTYYNCCPNDIVVCFYDEVGAFISVSYVTKKRTFVSPSDAQSMRFRAYLEYGFVYNNDICLNKSDSLNGTYSPYMPPSTLPITLPSVFADGIKSAPTATDELTPTKATARVGLVDLGSLVWAKNFFSAYKVIYAKFNHAYPGDVVKQCFLSDRYTDSGQYSISSMNNNNIIGLGHRFDSTSNTTQVVIRDTQYATADEFVASLQGVHLIYPLENPIETTLDETKAFYQVQNGGTEEIVKDNVAPFVADIAYRAEPAEAAFLSDPGTDIENE